MWEFGEEDPSVKGAGIVVTLLKRIQPPVHAAVAEKVSARQSLRDFHCTVFFSIAQVVVWVGADWAVAFVLGDILNVDIWAGHDEGQRCCCWYRKIGTLIVSRNVAYAGGNLGGFRSKSCQRA